MKYLTTLIFFAALYSCQQSSLITPETEDESHTLIATFSAQSFDSPTTRSTEVIEDIDIFIFDSLGERLHYRHIENYDNTEVHFILPTTTYSIAAIANSNSQFAKITTLDELTSSSVSYPSNVLSYLGEGLSTSAPDNANGVVTYSDIELSRTYAKVTTVFDNTNLEPSITITPTRISLCTTPDECLILADNRLKRYDSYTATSESITENLTPLSHSLATPLYSLENLQGTYGDPSTSQSDKTHNNARKNRCTYLEVEAIHDSPEGTRDVTYRYYLGMNTYNDFNLKRNCWYKVTIFFTGNGGVDENSWRVTLEDFTTYKSYLPSVGRRCYTFSLEDIEEFTPSSKASQGITLKESTTTAHLLLEEDYKGTTCEVIGTTILDGTATELHRLPESQSLIIPEVTNLFFPQNSLFGYTSYPITQFINFLSDSSLPESYYATSSEDWLYFGDGETFQPFSASRLASTTSSCDMYNDCSGAVNLRCFSSGYLAVRCDDNTSSASRIGYIKFYDSSSLMVAMVSVIQNPKDYPTSPVHLSYITGGWYKPGAWLSDGSLEATSLCYEYNSTNEFWEWESSFYIATTETTVQQFCDFLNDLGITSPDELLNTQFSELGKRGDLSYDYLGLIPPNGQLTTFCSGSPYSIEFNGKLWQPRKVSAYREGSRAYLCPITANNYPMDGISMFTAADYNYWALDRASRQSSRYSDPLLITELEWEAAARNISNKGNFREDNFNGLYPYPLYEHSDNTSLYSNMISASLNSTIMKFAWQCYEVSNGCNSESSISTKYPVGLLLPSAANLYDLGGNVREWCYDLANWQQDMPYSSWNSNTWYEGTNETDYAKRIFRGGNTQESHHTMCVTYRGGMEPNTTDESIGIRLVIR
ncbi:MAG: SUMF1/EgtB/PvdO family nonheme iron enzyme [Rikenellaceae bacterium]